MRPTHSTSGGTGTPIYDTLYSEYRRLFLTLPGDRSGEESLQFRRFAALHEGPLPLASLEPASGRHRDNRPLPALPAARSGNRMHGL